MDSRKLLKNTQKINVFIDSKTFDDLLRVGDRTAIAILKHSDSDLLKFVRTPFETELQEINKVIEYNVQNGENSEIKGIEIRREASREGFAFGYRNEDILTIAKEVCGKGEISEEELGEITTVFIQAVFNCRSQPSIYITNSDLLLKKRLWFESHFPGLQLNIMSIEEASIFLDLFFKKNEQYLISNRFRTNKGHWYWSSMRTKLKHYTVGDPIDNALANRFYYALMALDEMGIQYYLGPNNDTLDNTLYHFSYLITLITGVFDNLAIKTNNDLGIGFTRWNRISLSNSSGRNFLGKIKNKRPDLRHHINDYVDFINLIYSFREPIVHREGLSRTGFENCSGEKWKANFIKIDEETKRKIGRCGDKQSKYDPVTEWGCYSMTNQYFLSPYIFSLKIISKLNEFIEKYLILLGCPLYSPIAQNGLSRFEKYHLGF